MDLSTCYPQCEYFIWFSNFNTQVRYLKKYSTFSHRPPGPLMDVWKVTDDSSINFHNKIFLPFLLKFMEPYGLVVRKWTRWIRPKIGSTVLFWDNTHIMIWKQKTIWHKHYRLSTSSSHLWCSLIVTTSWEVKSHLITSSALGWIHLVHLLSLIHIWRCRRYSLCRSRWSPYH